MTARPVRRAPRAAPAAKPVRRALVLQGGGALGAYEFGVVKAITKANPAPPDVVTGVSIGALMAAILVGAKNDPIETLQNMWMEFSTPASSIVASPFSIGFTAFATPGLYRLNPEYIVAPMFARSMYDLSPLAHSIDSWIDFDKLNSSPTHVIVAAVDVQTGRLVEFDNRTGIKPEHLLASASLPVVFPSTVIDGHDYWDAGLILNTPLRPAINALERMTRDETESTTELIVVDLFEREAGSPQSLMSVVERTLELMFFGKFALDMKLFEGMNETIDLIGKIDAVLPKTSPVREHPAWRRMSRHRKIDRLIVIGDPDREALGGPVDFSRVAIELRIELGYRDGLRALKPRKARAA